LPDLSIIDKRHMTVKDAVYVMSSRGCPYQCTYCCNHSLQKIYKGKGKYVRFKSPKRVIQEIKSALKAVKVGRVGFGDDIFTIDRERAVKICRLYRKEIGLPFSILARADRLDLGLLNVLKNAGCANIAIGIEHGNDYIRNTIMKRGMDKSKIIETFRNAKAVGIKTYAFNMLGLPYETEETIRETIELNRTCNPDSIQISIFMPYEHTELRDMCMKNEWLADEQVTDYYSSSTLRLPGIHKDNLVAYHKTFLLYCYLPKYLHPFVDIVRKIQYRFPNKTVGNSIFLLGRGIGAYRAIGLKRFLKLTAGILLNRKANPEQ